MDSGFRRNDGRFATGRLGITANHPPAPPSPRRKSGTMDSARFIDRVSRRPWIPASAGMTGFVGHIPTRA